MPRVHEEKLIGNLIHFYSRSHGWIPYDDVPKLTSMYLIKTEEARRLQRQRDRLMKAISSLYAVGAGSKDSPEKQLAFKQLREVYVDVDCHYEV